MGRLDVIRTDGSLSAEFQAEGSAVTNLVVLALVRTATL